MNSIWPLRSSGLFLLKVQVDCACKARYRHGARGSLAAEPGTERWRRRRSAEPARRWWACLRASVLTSARPPSLLRGQLLVLGGAAYAAPGSYLRERIGDDTGEAFRKRDRHCGPAFLCVAEKKGDLLQGSALPLFL